jgi:hemoglobin/transferrin/lactoferrin receptor protein
MRAYFSLIFLLCFCLQSYAQKITVIGQSDSRPISGVAIYNTSKTTSTITDLDGIANLDNFTEVEPIVFSHISHQTNTLTKGQIRAQNNTVRLLLDTDQLETVVLSVSRFAQDKRDLAQRVLTMTQNDILMANPQTSADLLEGSGSVYVQKSQLGGGSPMIRGFSTNRVLIAVDGVRFNNAIFRAGNVQNVISIDPFTISRTEVILGPGSVVYGSDAVGGVMNFYTKKPAFSFVDGYSFSGNATARYSTANNEKTAHLDFNIGLKEWAFLTSVSVSDFEDLTMGSKGPDDYLRPDFAQRIDGQDVTTINQNPEQQVGTGYSQINFMQKVRYSPNKNWDFDLGLFYTATGDVPRYDRLIRRQNGALRSAEWYYGPQEWLSANFEIENSGTQWYDQVNFIGAFQQFKESRHDRDFGENILFETFEKVNAITGNLNFSKAFGSSNLYYGLEYVYNKVRSNGQQRDISTNALTPDASRYPDGSTWQSMAAYASHQWKITSDLTLQSGLRYSHVLLDASFDDTFYDFPFSEANIDTGALTGSLGLAWNPNKTIGWKANFSTAFRAPNIDDVGKIFDSEPGSVVVPNPDLSPEYAYTGELGVTLNFDDVVTLDVAAFYTVLDDALVRRDFDLDGENTIQFQGETSNVQAIQNAGQARVYGLETGLNINFSEALSLRSQFNITDGFTEEDDGSEAPIRHAAPPFGNTRLLFKGERLQLNAGLEYNGQFSFNDLAPSQQNNAFLYATDANGNPFSPSWYTFNLGGQYKLTKALMLTANLDNITDERYRPYSSGIAAPGRNLIVAATYSF